MSRESPTIDELNGLGAEKALAQADAESQPIAKIFIDKNDHENPRVEIGQAPTLEVAKEMADELCRVFDEAYARDDFPASYDGPLTEGCDIYIEAGDELWSLADDEWEVVPLETRSMRDAANCSTCGGELTIDIDDYHEKTGHFTRSQPCPECIEAGRIKDRDDGPDPVDDFDDCPSYDDREFDR